MLLFKRVEGIVVCNEIVVELGVLLKVIDDLNNTKNLINFFKLVKKTNTKERGSLKYIYSELPQLNLNNKIFKKIWEFILEVYSNKIEVREDIEYILKELNSYNYKKRYYKKYNVVKFYLTFLRLNFYNLWYLLKNPARILIIMYLIFINTNGIFTKLLIEEEGHVLLTEDDIEDDYNKLKDYNFKNTKYDKIV